MNTQENADRINAIIQETRFFCQPGKRALVWFRRYINTPYGEKSGYGVSKSEAMFQIKYVYHIEIEI